MDKLNISKTIAYGNFAFSHAERAEAVYVQLVEKLYSLGEDVADRIDSPERIADALIAASAEHRQRRGGYKLAEKALFTACRILNRKCPDDTAKLASAYKLLGHVSCRQGKHCQALKYNTLAALLLLGQPTSSPNCQGR